jgi:hypothetical protein
MFAAHDNSESILGGGCHSREPTVWTQLIAGCVFARRERRIDSANLLSNSGRSAGFDTHQGADEDRSYSAAARGAENSVQPERLAPLTGWDCRTGRTVLVTISVAQAASWRRSRRLNWDSSSTQSLTVGGRAWFRRSWRTPFRGDSEGANCLEIRYSGRA